MHDIIAQLKMDSKKEVVEASDFSDFELLKKRKKLV